MLIIFLNKDIIIEEKPNTRIEDNVLDMLMSAFASDKALKNRSEQKTTERKESR